MASKPPKNLTKKQQRFVEEYFATNFNATKAAIAAGYSDATAYSIGTRLLKDARIKALVDDRMAELADKADITATEVMLMIKDMATANVNELVELHRDCCRYCYGRDHNYHETPREHRERKLAHAKLLEKTPAKEWASLPAFDDLGGVGFDPRKPPVDDCPECFGRGVQTILAKNTADLTRKGKMIYQGVKTTASGIEVKIPDQWRAIDRLAMITGLLGKDDAGSGDVTVNVKGGLPEAPS